MSQENKFDEVDNLMFEYFNSNNNIPESTKDIVNNVFYNRKKCIINNLKKVAVYIVSIAVVTSSVVLADGFINTQNNIFVNSTDAIDAAVENGYIQSVDMDFVYDNNIGIRVNKLVLDDKTADISFEYNTGNVEYSSIMLDEHKLKSTSEVSSEIHMNGFRRYKKTRKLNNNTFNESIIYHLDEMYSDFDKIYFEIESVIVKEDEVYRTIEGNWKFEIELSSQMLNRNTEKYKILENESIENISAKLSELTFSVDMELNEKIDVNCVNGKQGIILKDKNDEEYRYRTVSAGNGTDGEKKGKIYIEFDISKFQENLDELELYIKINKDKQIKLELKK